MGTCDTRPKPTTEDETRRRRNNVQAKIRRNIADKIRKDLGLVRVRGTLGGIYWE